MQFQIHNPVASSVKRRIQLVVAIAICCFGVNLQAQEPAIDADNKTLDQTKAVRAIYDATKTANTAKDFTAFLKQCDDALASELTPENRNYVVSLTGWGLNRRGEKSFEMAVQLKRIGNKQHESAMKQAFEDFDAAIIAAPERHRSWNSRGIAHVACENYEKAILDFTEVTKIKTDEPSGWFNRAEAFYHRGNYGPAIRDYDVALRLNSSDAQALTGRGLSALAQGELEDALTDFNRVIELHQDNDAAYLNRGDAHQELGKWQLALEDYQRAIKIKETGLACQRMAWLKATCPDPAIHDLKMARKMIERAIALIGDTPENLDTLAAAEAAEGDFDAAKMTQQKVIALVSGEEDLQAEPYQARLMLYEKSEPFVQKIDDREPAEQKDNSGTEKKKE